MHLRKYANQLWYDSHLKVKQEQRAVIKIIIRINIAKPIANGSFLFAKNRPPLKALLYISISSPVRCGQIAKIRYKVTQTITVIHSHQRLNFKETATPTKKKRCNPF